jgi:hypothetical protein
MHVLPKRALGRPWWRKLSHWLLVWRQAGYESEGVAANSVISLGDQTMNTVSASRWHP